MSAAEHGEIWLEAYNADRVQLVTYSSTTSDAMSETHVMTGCLELERAVRLRKVAFKPHAVGALVVVSPYASLWSLLTGWWKAKSEALKK